MLCSGAVRTQLQSSMRPSKVAAVKIYMYIKTGPQTQTLLSLNGLSDNEDTAI